MIDVVNDIFSKEERKKCLKDLQPLLVKFPNCPGKQTHPTLHLHPDFTFLINDILKIVLKETGLDLVVADKVWINWTNGSKKDINWHCHPCDYALVYYMKTPLPFFSNGTLFREGLFKAPQNSMIIFPGDREHTAPSSPFRFGRYSLAMELNMGNRALT